MAASFKLFVWREDLGDWANHYLVVARDQDEAKKTLLEYMVEPWQSPKEKEREREIWSINLSKGWQEVNIAVNVEKAQVVRKLI